MTKRTEPTTTFAELFNAVASGMGWDDEKTKLWFMTENPHLGGVTPVKLWAVRPEKLQAWVAARLDENRRPE